MPGTDPENAAPRVIVDPRYGYRRLDPVPEEAELSSFYESRYYESLRRGVRGADLETLTTGGEEAERERAWLRKSLHAEVLAALERHAPGRRLLDVGAGTGELVAAAAEAGFDALGIEPSEEAATAARERGADVATTNLAGFLGARGTDSPFDAVTLMNVLEHLPDPVPVLERVRSLLSPGGVCFVQVPNDFNRLQLAAQAKLGLPSWWVTVPDHVNYFSLESFPAFARQLRYDTVELTTDFPMEMFLLMGIDYVSDPAEGKRCHELRVELELSMPAEVRRDLYASLAAHGLGRQVRALLRPA